MKENFEIRYDFIAEDGTRHQDMDGVKIANDRYWDKIIISTKDALLNKTSDKIAIELVEDINKSLRLKEEKYFRGAIEQLHSGEVTFEIWNEIYNRVITQIYGTKMISSTLLFEVVKGLVDATIPEIPVKEIKEFTIKISILRFILERKPVNNYLEYTDPEKVDKIEANKLDLKVMLKRQFKEKFELATHEITMLNIDFKQWDRYYILLMDAIKSGVVSKQDIVAFARNLRSASVITITIHEHEEYLKNQKVLNGIIDKINLEQGQARR